MDDPYQQDLGKFGQNYNKRSNAVTEMEMMLEGERRKGKEFRDRMEQELETERRLRLDFENKFIKLKDENNRREMLISELGYKVDNLNHENSSLNGENFSLKEELNRIQDAYNMRMRELHETCENQQRQMMEMEDGFKSIYFTIIFFS